MRWTTISPMMEKRRCGRRWSTFAWEVPFLPLKYLFTFLLKPRYIPVDTSQKCYLAIYISVCSPSYWSRYFYLFCSGSKHIRMILKSIKHWHSFVIIIKAAFVFVAKIFVTGWWTHCLGHWGFLSARGPTAYQYYSGSIKEERRIL